MSCYLECSLVFSEKKQGTVQAQIIWWEVETMKNVLEYHLEEQERELILEATILL